MTQGRGCVRTNKRKQDKFRKTSLTRALGLLLEGHQGEEMQGPIQAGLDVTGHQGGGAGEARAMGLEDHRTPLARRDLLGAELAPHLLTEHFSRRTRYRGQARLLQPREHPLQRDPVLLGNEEQLLR